MLYERSFGYITKASAVKSARERFQKNGVSLINFAFPGELMNLYEYEKEKAERKGIYLSKYDYLLMQINKFVEFYD